MSTIASSILPATLLILAVSGSGCCFPYKCGDATLLSCAPVIGREGERSYSVSLPTVSLAEPSITRFKVRGLKSSSYIYNLVMPLPRISQEESWSSKGRIPTWAAAVVNIRFIKIDGAIVSEQQYDLGASISNFNWPSDGRWQMSLRKMKGIESLVDYDVEIQVVAPSNRRADRARIEGWGSNVVLRLIHPSNPEAYGRT